MNIFIYFGILLILLFSSLGCKDHCREVSDTFNNFMIYESQGQRYDLFEGESFIKTYITPTTPIRSSWANIMNSYRIIDCYQDSTLKVIVKFRTSGMLVILADSSRAYLQKEKEITDTISVKNENGNIKFNIKLMPMITLQSACKILREELNRTSDERNKIKIQTLIEQLESIDDKRIKD